MSIKAKEFTGIILAGGLVAATALSVVHAEDRYVLDSKGDAVVDSLGNCWRTVHWTPDGYTEGCDPEPVVEEVVVVEPPAPVPVLQKVTLQTEALFDFDSAKLRPEGQEALRNLAAEINSLDDVDSITVDGYTDSTGPEEYNLQLSQRRAEAVKEALVSFGVDPDLITVHGYGESNPVASNDTREGRQQNRRAEITVVGDGLVNN